METIYNRAYIPDIYDQEEVASVEFTCKNIWNELTMVSAICIFQVIKPRPPWSRGNYCVFGL